MYKLTSGEQLLSKLFQTNIIIGQDYVTFEQVKSKTTGFYPQTIVIHVRPLP